MPQRQTRRIEMSDIIPLVEAAGRKAAQELAEQIMAGDWVPTPWMNPREAASYLRISRRELERRRHEGKPPSFHRDGTKIIRYHRDDLDIYMRSCPRENDNDTGQ